MGRMQTGPPYPSEPPTVAALGSWVLVLMIGRGWRGEDVNRPPAPHRTSDLDDVGACRRRALPWPAGVTFMSSRLWRLVSFWWFGRGPRRIWRPGWAPLSGSPYGVGVMGPRADGWTWLAWGRAGGAPGLGPLRFWNGSVGPAVPALHSSLFTLHSSLCTGVLTTGCCPPGGLSQPECRFRRHHREERTPQT